MSTAWITLKNGSKVCPDSYIEDTSSIGAGCEIYKSKIYKTAVVSNSVVRGSEIQGRVYDSKVEASEVKGEVRTNSQVKCRSFVDFGVGISSTFLDESSIKKALRGGSVSLVDCQIKKSQIHLEEACRFYNCKFLSAEVLLLPSTHIDSYTLRRGSYRFKGFSSSAQFRAENGMSAVLLNQKEASVESFQLRHYRRKVHWELVKQMHTQLPLEDWRECVRAFCDSSEYRGYNRVGAAWVHPSAVVERSSLGVGVIVGPKVHVIDSTLSDGVEIRSTGGAVTLEKCEVEKYTKISSWSGPLEMKSSKIAHSMVFQMSGNYKGLDLRQPFKAVRGSHCVSTSLSKIPPSQATCFGWDTPQAPQTVPGFEMLDAKRKLKFQEKKSSKEFRERGFWRRDLQSTDYKKAELRILSQLAGHWHNTAQRPRQADFTKMDPNVSKKLQESGLTSLTLGGTLHPEALKSEPPSPVVVDLGDYFHEDKRSSKRNWHLDP